MTNENVEFRCESCNHLLAAELEDNAGVGHPGLAICPKCGAGNEMPAPVVTVHSENEELEAAADTGNVG